jgi:origin recognition complex subunit 6
LNKDLTIKDVCVQLGCPEIASDAESLLEKWVHPIYLHF